MQPMTLITAPNATALIEIAESANAPYELDAGTFEHREFLARDGWRVVIFYDDGDLDYIEHFIAPDGTIVDFWKWPDDLPGRDMLVGWRG